MHLLTFCTYRENWQLCVNSWMFLNIAIKFQFNITHYHNDFFPIKFSPLISDGPGALYIEFKYGDGVHSNFYCSKIPGTTIGKELGM